VNTAIQVERIQEGYLVKGTLDVEEAKHYIHVRGQHLLAEDEIESVNSHWMRKVPGQWTTFSLYDAKPHARGAFKAVTVWLKSRSH